MKRAALCLIVAGALLGTADPATTQQPDRPRGVQPAQSQGWLGITFSYPRQGTGAAAREVAVVTSVHPGSPAQRAGLQRGDAVIQMNGRTDVEAQVRALRLQAGDTVRVRVRRAGERDRNLTIVADRRPVATTMVPAQGQRFEVRRAPGAGPGVIVINGDTVRIPVDSLVMAADSVLRRTRLLLADSLAPRLRQMEREQLPQLREQLRTMDSAMARAFSEAVVIETGRRAVAGAEFSELNPELAGYFQGAREGLLVLNVAPESPAARAGLQAGDVVVRANGTPVRTTTELRRSVAQAGRDEVRLDVVRKGRSTQVRLR